MSRRVFAASTTQAEILAAIPPLVDRFPAERDPAPINGVLTLRPNEVIQGYNFRGVHTVTLDENSVVTQCEFLDYQPEGFTVASSSDHTHGWFTDNFVNVPRPTFDSPVIEGGPKA